MNRITRKKNKDYTTISNVFLRDENLSLKAKGFLAVIMGLPDNWEFSINGICAILKEGKSAIYTTINELKENGYCCVTSLRNERGEMAGNDYTFSETPQTESPDTDFRHTDNQTQLNTNNNKVSKELNTYRTSVRFQKPSISEIKDYCKERGNDIDAEDFFDFYESKGWKVGNSPMKDWKAAIRTWEKREKKFAPKKRNDNISTGVIHVNDSVKDWARSVGLED